MIARTVRWIKTVNQQNMKISWLTGVVRRIIGLPMKIGYARTSPGETSLDAQRAALCDAGCAMIFEDSAVGASAVFKPAWGDALRIAKPGDVIVVTGLDRLARSYSALLTELRMLSTLQLGFASLSQGIEADAGGVFYACVEALAQFGADVAKARRVEQAAAETGVARRPGRQPTISEAQWEELLALMQPPRSMSAARVATLAGVSRQAIHKRLKAGRKVPSR